MSKMSRKVRAHAASKIGLFSRFSARKVRARAQIEKKRAKRAPKSGPQIVKKWPKNRQKIAQKAAKVCQQNITKKCKKNDFFCYILLFFRFLVDAIFDAFLVCFGRAVRRASRRGPPSVHSN